MKLQAVLVIKVATGKRILRYRIYCPTTKEMKDYPVGTVQEVLKRGVKIQGLRLNEKDEIVETTDIKRLGIIYPSNGNFEDICKTIGIKGERLLDEFNNGNNWPITPADVSKATTQKFGFKCKYCGKINSASIAEVIHNDYKCECRYASSSLNTKALDNEINKILEEKQKAREEENEVEQIKAYLKILEQQLSGLKAILNKEENT